METWIVKQLEQTSLNSDLIQVVTFLLIFIGIFVTAFITNFIAKNLILTYVNNIAIRTTNNIDDIFIKNKVFHNIAHLVPGLTIYFMANLLDTNVEVIQKYVLVFMIFVVAAVFFRILDSAVEVTRLKSPIKGGPLKGIVQVLKIIIMVFSVLLIIVDFLGNSTAWAIFSGIGGMSAILLLIFKDSILGLVAGFQLSSEKLLKLGDWLEMPKYNADGEVVDISLTKITVRNWDKTYTSIPAYKFIEDSFKNWEGMTEAGGRRIKRAINIDMNSIGFLTTEEIDELKNIVILRPYLEDKLDQILNEKSYVGKKENINNRNLTNIGTFRAYVELYLKAHPNIHQGYTLIVRQLSPTSNGLPIEIYCFAKETAWAKYESIQSDVFDHLLAIIPEFNLNIYQSLGMSNTIYK